MHPILLKTGLIDIHWYGVMMALGFLAATANCVYLGRKSGKDASFISDLLCWIMVSGIIGARLAHVTANFGDYRDDPISVLYIHRGGLIYYGGFIGAAVGILLFARLRRENLLGLYDMVAVAAPLSHAMGRLGCMLNGCCYGKVTHGITGIRYPLDSAVGWSHFRHQLIENEQVRTLMAKLRFSQISDDKFATNLSDMVNRGVISRTDGLSLPVHPAQLYEAALNILLYAVLMWFFFRKKQDGRIAALYLLGYPAIRFAVEFTRGDSIHLQNMFGLTVAQIVSILLFVAGIVAWIWLLNRERTQTDSTR